MSFYNQKRYYKKNNMITSYGVILYTYENNKIVYLISQRRDSIAYSEFLRNRIKSDSDFKKYIPMMSSNEKQRCLDTYYGNNSFDDLWDDLFKNHDDRFYNENKDGSCEKSFYVNMKNYIEYFKDTKKKENTWTFPKGRPNYGEDGIKCALREMEEETLINKDDVKVIDYEPFEEIYTGSDNKVYRSLYYLCYIKEIPVIKNTIEKGKLRKEECCISNEVSMLFWGTLREVKGKIKDISFDILKNVDNNFV